MKYDFCVSIPVHEEPKVILDQVLNIFKFLGDKTLVVLHLSKGFDFKGILNKDFSFLALDNVAINPFKLPTARGNLVHIHNSNFKFAKTNFDFDFFLLHASNDMYVKHGGGGYIISVKNGINQQPTSKELNWKQSKMAHEDIELKNIMKHLGCDDIFGTQPEGLFFQKEVFNEMVDVIDKFFMFGRNEHYCREEIYYSTIIKKFTNDIATPLLYSELCRKKIDFKLINSINQGNYKEEEIDDNGIGKYKLYDFDNIYAVKRINRKYNDGLRKQIRSLN